jgi:hypothetical protein
MAIKISNNTIIDDDRSIVNASRAGIGTTNPSNALTVIGDSNITGISTANYFDGFFPGGDKVYDENTTINNNKVNIALESDIIVDSGRTLTVSAGSTIVLNPFDFETSSVDELLVDKVITVGLTTSFDVVTSGIASVGITSTRLVGFGTVLPPNIETGLLVKEIPGIISAGTTVVSFVSASSATGVSTITISPASLNTGIQTNITFKFGTFGEKKSGIILDGETSTIKVGNNTVIIDGENSKVTLGNIDLDGSDGFTISDGTDEKLRLSNTGTLSIGAPPSDSFGPIAGNILRDSINKLSTFDGNVEFVGNGNQNGNYSIGPYVRVIGIGSATGDIYPEYEIRTFSNNSFAQGGFNITKNGLTSAGIATIVGSDTDAIGRIMFRTHTSPTESSHAARIDVVLNSRNITGSGNRPSADFRFFTRSSSNTTQTGLTRRMTLKGDTGRLGIGVDSPSNQLQLSTDSAGKPSTNTWTIVSDERIKEEIELANLDICYNAVKSIPLKRYKWRDDVYTTEQVTDRHKIGWIAQDVELVFPKAVNVNEFRYNQVYEEPIESLDEGELDEEGNIINPTTPKPQRGEAKLISEDVIEDCKNLNADQIYAAMYGAIQKLIEKVETLESTVALLS